MTELTVELRWGLGDVLLSTSALHRYKELHPDTRITYRTYTMNKGGGYTLEYALGNPAELLRHNPDIDVIEDAIIPARAPVTHFRYAWFGGPSLDYPIQAHFYENLGLEWEQGQRFDSVYYYEPWELEWARENLAIFGDAPILVVSQHTGWPGKGWSEDGWRDLIAWAVAQGIGVVVLGGAERQRADDRRGVLNLEGKLNMRATAAILAVADHAVLIEGGLSNIRFALGRPVTLLTCATQAGLQIWTPPELTTEIRMRSRGYRGPEPGIEGWPACEPCMWRRDHVLSARSDLPPASIRRCPAGRSLRDVPASIVILAVEAAIRKGSLV